MKVLHELGLKIENYLKDREFAIICLGNEIRGDDQIGLYIGELLVHEFPLIAFKILIAHTVPASYLGKIIKIDPQCLLVIDAADFGEAPGTIALMDYDVVEEMSYSTHFQEYDRLLAFLEIELDHKVDCKILAIQIASTGLMDPMTEEVKHAGKDIISTLSRIL